MRTKKKVKDGDPTSSLSPDGLMQYYAKLGDVEAMRKAFQEGAKVNVPDHGPVNLEGTGDLNYPITGDYPLHAAAGAGHKAALNELLNWEADLESKNRIGSTPLHRAVSSDQIEIVKRLIEEGASINCTNKIGNTPLHCATFVGSVDMVKLLIEKKATAQILQANLCGATPLMIASQNSAAVLKYFMSLQSGYKESKRLLQHDRTNTNTEGAPKRGSIIRDQPQQQQDSQQQSLLEPQKRSSTIKKSSTQDDPPSYLGVEQRSVPAPSTVDPPSTGKDTTDVELSTIPQPSVRKSVEIETDNREVFEDNIG